MPNVLHISTECYPAAKAGGMADVVGALPLFQKKYDWHPSVVIPMYRLPWFDNYEFESIYKDTLNMNFVEYNYEVLRCLNSALGFEFYCISQAELFDRDSIYLNEYGHGFHDEAQRNMGFQRSVLQWLQNTTVKFDLLHCHDHQTGFIPFMIKHCSEYRALSYIPTFYTIHNGAYNSRYDRSQKTLLPHFDNALLSDIEWDKAIDSVACALKYSDHINAVSPTYLQELKGDMAPLQVALEQSPNKFSGILNGIDEELWDPKTDERIPYHLGKSWDTFKAKNKQDLLNGLYRVKDVPLFSFIGRFAHQKGADLLAPSIERILSRFGFSNFFILGSGDKYLEHQIQSLRDKYPERVACYIGYNEDVAHQVYAASDFLLMPSRFEPCGLNQMFAMRYGAIPIARKTGGLKDTVIDFEQGGAGVSFDYDSSEDLMHAMARGLHLYRNQKEFKKVRKKGIAQDYSWKKSTQEYTHIYNHLIKSK